MEVEEFIAAFSMNDQLAPGLHIVATPIGNLGDLSPRAADTLRHANDMVNDDCTLVVWAPAADERAAADELYAAGVGKVEADVLLVAGDPRHEGELLDRAHVALTHGALHSPLPAVGDASGLAALKRAL